VKSTFCPSLLPKAKIGNRIDGLQRPSRKRSPLCSFFFSTVPPGSTIILADVPFVVQVAVFATQVATAAVATQVAAVLAIAAVSMMALTTQIAVVNTT